MPAHNAASNLAQAQGATLASNGSISALYVNKIHDLHELNAVTSPGLAICGSTKVGFFGATPVTQQSALTAQLTTITIADAAGTPDYAIQAITQTTPYGFADSQELISLLYVIKNLQTRLAEVEVVLENMGFCAAN